jgi:hypothetical protein
VSAGTSAASRSVQSAPDSGSSPVRPTPATQTSPAQGAPSTNSQQRVVLYVNRTTELAGYVEQEDAELITIRTPRNQVESFPKSRVLRITRLVDPGPGQWGVVYLRDGQTREGTVIEDHFDYVLIEIKGIRAKLKRDTVDHVTLSPTFEQRYADAKAMLQPGHYESHLALCKWIVEQRRYELARTELLQLLEQTDLPEAQRLLNQVDAVLALKNPTTMPASTQPDADGADSSDASDSQPVRKSGPVYPADILPNQIISREDVNIIRVFEIDFDPRHSTKITIAPDTIRELIEKYGSSKLIPASQTGRNSMFHADPLDIARLMFELRARDLYPQIQVNSEPYALNLFRQRVHDTWLMNNCATNACHGGVNAGSFFLYNRNSKDDRVRYTNLLILERLQLDPQWPLVNYEHPEDSLIIQYGQPRDLARKPHPLVPGWKPVLGPNVPKLREGAVEWINAMMKPRPEYPVVFDPPKLPGVNASQTASDASDPARPAR